MSKKNRILNLKNIKEKSRILKEVAERTKRYERIETACRDLCLQNGIDPDMIVCRQMPAYLNYPLPAYIIPDPQYTMKAWWLYRDIVEDALKILEATNAKY